MRKNLIAVVSIGFVGLACSGSAMAELKRFYQESVDQKDCGYKNERGKVVVPLKTYQDCGTFKDGLAYVGRKEVAGINGNTYDRYWQGFIDQTGDLVIPVEHEVYSEFWGGLYNDFSEGLVAVYKDDKYGYMDKQRVLAIPYQYDYARRFINGLAVVGQNDKQGIIDRTGKIAIPIKFNTLSNYSEGMAVYSEINHWNDKELYGLIDRKGDVAIKAQWSGVLGFSEGLSVVRLGSAEHGKWGVIDMSGNYVVKPRYDEIEIQVWNDEEVFDDGRYIGGKLNMYQYTDNNNPLTSTIIRHTLNKTGNVVAENLFNDWDAVAEDYRRIKK